MAVGADGFTPEVVVSLAVLPVVPPLVPPMLPVEPVLEEPVVPEPDAPMELVLPALPLPEVDVSVLAVPEVPDVPLPVLPVVALVLGEGAGVEVLEPLVEADGEVLESSFLLQALRETTAASAMAAAEIRDLFMGTPRGGSWDAHTLGKTRARVVGSRRVSV